ncbi:MAG: DUF4404 family protein [Prosthecobacter sp.]
MSEEQLQQLRGMVEGADELSETARAELIKRVANAQEEAAVAESVPHDYMSRLMSSVEELEASHPDATAFMNRVAHALGNMGI